MKDKYLYKVYGLDIESEIKIDEFKEVDSLGKNIINIRYEQGSNEVNNMKEEGLNIVVRENEVFFDVDDVAAYYVANGNTIIVQPYDNSNSEMVKIYIMCSCLGFILIQRNMVAIHGGVVDMYGKAVIFTGHRGAGKSTLTTALRKKGYKFIADDVASLVINEDVMVMPGFPYQKLCEDALASLDYDKEKFSYFISDEKIKYLVPTHDEFSEVPTKLNAVFEITVATSDNEEVNIEEIRGYEKFLRLTSNIYRGEFIGSMGGVKPDYFRKCMKIASSIKYYKINRPKNKFTVNEQIELVEEIIRPNRV